MPFGGKAHVSSRNHADMPHDNRPEQFYEGVRLASNAGECKGRRDCIVTLTEELRRSPLSSWHAYDGGDTVPCQITLDTYYFYNCTAVKNKRACCSLSPPNCSTIHPVTVLSPRQGKTHVERIIVKTTAVCGVAFQSWHSPKNGAGRR